MIVTIEAVAQRGSIKKVFLEISQNSQENTCYRVSFLIKLYASACNFIKKETLAEVFSCSYMKIWNKYLLLLLLLLENQPPDVFCKKSCS